MAEDRTMRLNKVALKLKRSTSAVVEFLASKGIGVDGGNNPNAKINGAALELLAKEFNTPDLLDEMGSPAASAIEAPVATLASPTDEIRYLRTEKPEPEKISFDNKITGPKVIGKIDLDKKPNTPAPAAVIPSPEPKVAIPEPKVEEPVAVVEKPKVEEPKIEEKPAVIAPVEIKAEPAPQPEPEPAPKPIVEIAEVKEEVKEIVKEIVKEEVKVVAPAVVPVLEEEEPEAVLIKAQGDKLQGLTVLGKIQLPVERKPLTKEELKQKRKRKRVIVGEKVADTTKPAFDNFRKDRPGTPGGAPGARPNTGQRPPISNAPAPNTGGTNTPNSNTTNNNNNSSNNNNNKNKKGKDGKRDSFSDTDVKDSIKNTMSKMQSKGPDFGSKYRKEKRRNRAEQQEAMDAHDLEQSGILKVTEYISASELSSLMNVSVNEVIGSCMKMGIFASINQRLDAETIQLLALEFGFEVEFISAEEEVDIDTTEVLDSEESLLGRAPIVTIMGHVDHGKTSLLDYIRRSKVANSEAGGITQHIGAYSVKIKEGPNKGKALTFLDTPGHEAFTAMRARGAKVTDIVIIVISADDSVMPQTKEAINHAQNAGVPIVFALNKIDKPNANAAKIREDLSKENILVESWGGKYQEQEVSAKSGLGIDELLDKVLLEAELLELKANPNRKSVGTVIEASLDKGRGYVSTILVQTGTLKVGDILLAGQYFGRVRAMVNDIGEKITEAGPSQPVQILGLPGAPQAGDKFNVMESDREAREIANKREQLNREMSIRSKKHITLDEIGRRKAIGSFKELNVIVKGDVDGSVEALSDSLLKLSTEEVQVRIVHKGVGQISESDVTLASAADAIVIGFQVRPSNNARKIADSEEIEIRLYSIIYDAINEIRDAMEGMLAPKEEEVITGNIEIREVFKISKVGTIAGCYVTDGNVKRSNKVRIIREGIVLHEGEIAQLRRFKDDVADVRAGYECGVSIKNFNNLEVGDIIESFEMKELKRKL